jgi:hypothetical protein
MPPKIQKMIEVFKIANNIIFIIFGIAACIQLFQIYGNFNWMIHPLIGNIFGLGIGICFSIIFFVLSYLAWSLNENEFDQWSLEQIKPPLLRKLISSLRESRLVQLQARIIGPIGFLLCFAAVIYILYQIIFSAFR